jgi:hypothetical protein
LACPHSDGGRDCWFRFGWWWRSWCRPSMRPRGLPRRLRRRRAIYAAGGTPCEAAYSTTRALFGSYNGPLYQIQRSSDGSALNVGLKSAGGLVNSAPQVSFCSGTSRTITQL